MLLRKKDYDKAIEVSKHVSENTCDFSRRASAFGIIGYSLIVKEFVLLII